MKRCRVVRWGVQLVASRAPELAGRWYGDDRVFAFSANDGIGDPRRMAKVQARILTDRFDGDEWEARALPEGARVR